MTQINHLFSSRKLRGNHSFVFVFVFCSLYLYLYLLTTDGGNEERGGEVITRSPLGAGPGLPRALSRIQKIPHLRIHQLSSKQEKEKNAHKWIFLTPNLSCHNTPNRLFCYFFKIFGKPIDFFFDVHTIQFASFSLKIGGEISC